MRALLILIAALLCVGCTHYEPVSLHGAGSMRVEVEVYKGPLSVSREAQVGQLVAVMSDMVRATVGWREATRGQFANLLNEQTIGCANRRQAGEALTSDPPDCRLPCAAQEYRHHETSATDMDARDCAALRAALESSGDVIGAACYIIHSPTLMKTVGPAVYLPVGTCESAANQIFWPHLGTYRLFLDEALAACGPGEGGLAKQPFELLQCQGQTIVVAIENMSSLMRTSAFRVADGNVAFVPRDIRVRSALARFGYIASEYGNQIEGRIAVLNKLLGKDPPDARNLPVGDYLRSARPTDFVQLFDWLKAGDPDSRVLSVQERVRMAERLTADFYWEKVNEVYASGQGDLSMAFIKDDLGNWNLKSFSNDPRALLASYRKVADAAFKAAARLATDASTGGGASLSKAAQAASLANQLATGQVPGTEATVAGLDVSGLHERAAGRIATIKTRFATRARDLATEIASQTAAVEKAKADVATATAAKTEAAKDSADTDAARAKLAETSAALVTAGESLKSAQNALDRAQRRNDELPGEAIEALRAALGDHLAVIAAMQDGIAASSAKPGTP